MTVVTMIWMAAPFLAGFASYLFAQLGRWLALLVAIASLSYGIFQVVAPVISPGISPEPMFLQLVDNFGVTLLINSTSGYFIMTNALVTAAVVLYGWHKSRMSFFRMQLIILHGSVNAVFICADFISAYVALEVISVAAFLLISHPRTNRSIWVGLRYLFISNTAMLFYLIGAVLVYQASGTFAFEGLAVAPTEAIALIILGLLTKGGIFVSGLWLPMTHAESATPVSAMLSGTVVNTGLFPLIRCALLVDNVGPTIQIFSVATAFLGVLYAIVESDTKRLLAASTISQVGFIMAAPPAAGLYALTHGLAKASLFFNAGQLPSRKFAELRTQGISLWRWITLAIASLSIAGLPLFAGFEAKALTLKGVPPWQSTALSIAAVGTAIAFAKFIFLPIAPNPSKPAPSHTGHSVSAPLGDRLGQPPMAADGGMGAVGLLVIALVLASGWHYSQYTVATVGKALLTAGVGWGIHGLMTRRLALVQPRGLEAFDHLIGGMSLMLLILIGMVVT